jgi:hypothetical protein
MKTTLAIVSVLTLAFGMSNCSESHESVDVKRTYLAAVDSFIVIADYKTVYISSDTNSTLYERLNETGLSNRTIETSVDTESIAELEKKTDVNVKKNSFNKLPKRWVKLHEYENEFFLYSPSGEKETSEVLITDSIFYRINPARIGLSLITKIEENSNGSIYIGVENSSQIVYGIELTPLKDQPEIYHWKYFDASNEVLHEEYRIPIEKTNQFRVIVNDCFEVECIQEFHF